MADEMPPLVVKQGATYSFGFTWHRDAEDQNGDPILDGNGDPTPGDPYDLAGCSARMQIRRRKGDAVLVRATSESPYVDPQAALKVLDDQKVADGAGRIVLEDGDGSRKGHVRVTLTDLDTQALIVKNAVFDLEIEWPLQDGEIRPRVDRPLQGSVQVSLNITEDT